MYEDAQNKVKKACYKKKPYSASDGYMLWWGGGGGPFASAAILQVFAYISFFVAIISYRMGKCVLLNNYRPTMISYYYISV